MCQRSPKGGPATAFGVRRDSQRTKSRHRGFSRAQRSRRSAPFASELVRRPGTRSRQGPDVRSVVPASHEGSASPHRSFAEGPASHRSGAAFRQFSLAPKWQGPPIARWGAAQAGSVAGGHVGRRTSHSLEPKGRSLGGVCQWSPWPRATAMVCPEAPKGGGARPTTTESASSRFVSAGTRTAGPSRRTDQRAMMSPAGKLRIVTRHACGYARSSSTFAPSRPTRSKVTRLRSETGIASGRSEAQSPRSPGPQRDSLIMATFFLESGPRDPPAALRRKRHRRSGGRDRVSVRAGTPRRA